jgi:hypothetical protein
MTQIIWQEGMIFQKETSHRNYRKIMSLLWRNKLNISSVEMKVEGIET